MSTILFIGFKPMLCKLFCSHFGESFISTSEIKIPEYLGHAEESWTLTSSFNFFEFDSDKLSFGRFIEEIFKTDFKSRATPKWEAASALFGVNDISNIKRVDYIQFTPILINCVKELKSKNKILEDRVSNLENKLEKISKLLE